MVVIYNPPPPPTTTAEPPTTTEAPTTVAPTTVATTTEVPTTEAPTTQGPATEESSTTQNPTTEEESSSTPPTIPEPTAEEPVIEDVPLVGIIEEEPESTTVVPTAATTRPPVRATEPFIDRRWRETEEYEEVSELIPIGNSLWAKYDEDEDIWYIYDENGVPLGYIILPEGEDIEEYDVVGNLIPLGNFELPEPAEPQKKPNPNTGDMPYLTLIFAALCAIALNIARKRLKAK